MTARKSNFILCFSYAVAGLISAAAASVVLLVIDGFSGGTVLAALCCIIFSVAFTLCAVIFANGLPNVGLTGTIAVSLTGSVLTFAVLYSVSYAFGLSLGGNAEILFFVTETVCSLALMFAVSAFLRRRSFAKIIYVIGDDGFISAVSAIADADYAHVIGGTLSSEDGEQGVTEFSDRVTETLLHAAADEVIIQDGALDCQTVDTVKSMGVAVHIQCDRAESDDVIFGIPVNNDCISKQRKISLFFKRLFDIVCSLIGLILSVPIILVVCIPLVIESPGSPFFRQKRVGKNGRIFYMYKLRSMCVNADAMKAQLMGQNEMQGNMFKMKDDPRITKVGKFIRKTSIDELPQFLNILLGDMSLIGTRPPTYDEFMNYKPHHKRRLSMTPGLTGLWQVSGRNDISDFEEVVKLDTTYIDNFSILFDIKIIFKTFSALFRHHGE